MHGMVAKNATMTRHERAVAAITVSSTYSSAYVLSSLKTAPKAQTQNCRGTMQLTSMKWKAHGTETVHA
jgi:hypothetical protein